MDFVSIITDLRAEYSLAELARKASISRAYMSDLASGKARSPSYQVGKVFVDLHKSISSTPSRRARA